MASGNLPEAVAGARVAVPTRAPSLGARSRAIKRRHRLRRAARAAIAAAAIWVAALVAGFAIDGIGTAGLIATFALMIAAVAGFLAFPRLRAPSAGDLTGARVNALAGDAELYLETQRPRLPAPAQPLLDRIGGEIDALAPQLATLDDADPAAHEARRLLGEHLPGLIASYTRIPEPLRRAPNAGSTPERQLVAGLDVIAREIGEMTGAIARGDLDALATRGRYLETKYPGDGDGPPAG